jgi:hypothetical protein
MTFSLTSSVSANLLIGGLRPQKPYLPLRGQPGGQRIVSIGARPAPVFHTLPARPHPVLGALSPGNTRSNHHPQSGPSRRILGSQLDMLYSFFLLVSKNMVRPSSLWLPTKNRLILFRKRVRLLTMKKTFIFSVFVERYYKLFAKNGYINANRNNIIAELTLF